MKEENIRFVAFPFDAGFESVRSKGLMMS